MFCGTDHISNLRQDLVIPSKGKLIQTIRFLNDLIILTGIHAKK
ncbi:MAG: hypothetical protein WC466_00730 [Candidatus Izemoplasmatales bacterium]